jgi:hypothetical protein
MTGVMNALTVRVYAVRFVVSPRDGPMVIGLIVKR